MQKITLELFLEQEAKHPGRRCFAQNSGVQKNKKPGACRSFSVRFKESISPIYEAMTPYSLRYNPSFDNYWHPLNTDEDVLAVEEWEQQQGTRVFLRDCLSCSVALDHNFTDNTSGIHTAIGQLEYDAKNNHDQGAVVALVQHLAGAIRSLPFYSATKLITAVPGRKEKSFDLPSVLAAAIASELGLKNVTEHFSYLGDKGQLKSTAYGDRWTQLENAGLNMTEEGKTIISGRPVILVDDKYQSGVTANYVAMVLQQHGAAEIYGLYAVKTLGDKDNC